jgi:hypothetical protein
MKAVLSGDAPSAVIRFWTPHDRIVTSSATAVVIMAAYSDSAHLRAVLRIPWMIAWRANYRASCPQFSSGNP